MVKKNWLVQARQAAKELRAAQRKLYRCCGPSVNLLDMAAIELLGFVPGQYLLCRSTRSFSASNVEIGQVWEIKCVTFSSNREVEEQEVLNRTPWLAVQVHRGYGTRWLHGTRHAFHTCFVTATTGWEEL